MERLLRISQLLHSNKAKPVKRLCRGWKSDIRGITKYEELPVECRNYIEAIEQEIEAPITMVSNGPGRHEIILERVKFSIITFNITVSATTVCR